MNNNDQYRKSPRANWIYYNSGSYFVTICTQDMRHHFGEITDGVMHMSETGQFLHDELANVHLHHPHIVIPLFVVMPNHFHAIIIVNKPDSAVAIPGMLDRYFDYLPKKQRPLLSSFVGSLKSSVTRYAHQRGVEFAWQPRFHDHLIRDNRDGNNIAEYILHNVSNWMHDKFNTIDK